MHADRDLSVDHPELDRDRVMKQDKAYDRHGEKEREWREERDRRDRELNGRDIQHEGNKEFGMQHLFHNKNLDCRVEKSIV